MEAPPRKREATLPALVAQKQNISQDQADQEIAGWQTKLQQAKQQTSTSLVNAAGDAASGISRTALWGSLALLLGLIAATLGGYTGSPTSNFRKRTAAVHHA